MKLYNKDQVKFIADKGIIVNKDDEIIQLPRDVVDQLNKLETEVQKAEWLKTQPAPVAEPITKFKRESAFGCHGFKWEAKTPALDKKADESLKLLKEIRAVEEIEEMNAMNEEYSDLIEFLNSDSFISADWGPVIRIDTPYLGNPLEMTPGEFALTVAYIHGLDLADDEEEDDVESF